MDLFVVPVVIAGFLSMAATVLLWWRVARRWQAARWSSYSDQDAGLCDLLLWDTLVDDGVLICKDGALAAGWRLDAADLDLADPAFLVEAGARVNRAIRNLDEGWTLHLDAVRRPVQGSSKPGEWPDWVSEAIDDERRHRATKAFQPAFILVATYSEPPAIRRGLRALMKGTNNETEEELGALETRIKKFQAWIEDIESRLNEVYEARRLRRREVRNSQGSRYPADELVDWLHETLSGRQVAIRAPKVPRQIDALVQGEELVAGHRPRMGSEYVGVLSIVGFPEQTVPGLLNALLTTDFPFRLCQRFIVADKHAALSEIDRHRDNWSQKLFGFASLFQSVIPRNEHAVDMDAAAMVDEANMFAAELNSGSAGAGFYSGMCVLRDSDPDRLEKKLRRLREDLSSVGIVARIEELNATEAFLASLPCHRFPNVRRPLVSSVTFADIAPTSRPWTGSIKPPCRMYPQEAGAAMNVQLVGGERHAFNLHVEDVGHTIMFGPTGAGKSVHLALLAAQLRRYKGMRVVCLDKGRSMYALAAAINAATAGRHGQHLSLGPGESGLSLCPLDDLSSSEGIAWGVTWLSLVCQLHGYDLTIEDRRQLADAVGVLQTFSEPSLDMLVGQVDNRKVRQILELYGSQGQMKGLLDAPRSAITLSDFQVFEVEELLRMDDSVVVATLEVLFRRIQSAADGRPMVVIIDEFWMLAQHPVFAPKVREWLKVFRKANVSIVMATQSLGDAVDSPLFESIVESVASKIFLPNGSATEKNAHELYTRMGLNPREIEELSELRRKEQYFLKTSSGDSAVYSLELGPVARAFCGASSKEELGQIQTLQTSHGQDWPRVYLDRLGLIRPRSNLAA